MRTLFILLFSLPVFFFPSCKSPAPPITDADFKRFADHMDTAFAKVDTTFIFHNFDTDAMADSALKNLGIGIISELQFRQGFAKGLEASVANIMQAIHEGQYQRLRMVKRASEWRVLYRLYTNAGVNYHEYVLKERDGKIQIHDLFVYVTGEYLSQSMSFLFKTQAAFVGRSPIPGLSNISPEVLQNFRRIKRFREKIDEQQPEEAIAIFDSLSPDLKNLKSVRILYMKACHEVSDSAYVRSIEEMQQLFPGDTSLSMVLVDGYFLNEDYDKALECIDQLNAKVKDPYQDYIRGNIYYRMDSLDKAIAVTEHAADSTKGMDVSGVYNNLLVFYERKQDEKGMVQTCEKMISRGIRTKEQVKATLSGYAWFRTTAGYRQLFPD